MLLSIHVIGKKNMKVTMIDVMGTDLTVVDAARISFNKKAPHLREKDKKLIKYLAENKHYSPFGHCFASFHVKAPIFVARQLVKHKFLRWNEISRRYIDEEPELFFPYEWRERSEDKKQGSCGSIKDTSIIDDEVTSLYGAVLDVYDMLLYNGVAPEQARMVLPVSQMTEWYWSGSLDAFADMCNLRLKEDTQAETREVAEQVSDLMREKFPVSWGALVK